MKIITFPFLYLLNLTKINPAKIIIITIGCIFFNYAGTIPDQLHERTIIKEMQMDGKWVYLYEDSDGIKAYSQRNREVLVGKNKNTVKWKSYAGGNIGLWLGFIICLIIVFVQILSDDGEWDLGEVFNDTIKYYIKCEIEDNFYVYTVFGRLIDKSSYNMNRFDLYRISDISILPKYKLRSELRDEKINSIIK